MARGGIGTAHGITLQQLRYFVEVAAEGSIARAAEKLGVAQPTVSEQIRQLERTLGGIGHATS